MARFRHDGSIADFQRLIEELYRTPDDQLFSLFQLISVQARFTMRVVKGIRKDDKEMVRRNLLLAFSWLMTVANRMHIDVSTAMWKRFPGVCSYCGEAPCACKTHKVTRRVKIKEELGRKPRTLIAAQEKIGEIYPPSSRTLAHAGIHLAEEMGEVSESVYRYYANPTDKQCEAVKTELADYSSVIFNVANSAGINMGEELSKLYHNNCYDCHTCPCTCDLSHIAASAT